MKTWKKSGFNDFSKGTFGNGGQIGRTIPHFHVYAHFAIAPGDDHIAAGMGNVIVNPDFVFFLEIKLKEKQYITIRRSVESPSKVYLNFHEERAQDFSELEDAAWSQPNISFNRANCSFKSLIWSS